jgi:protein TIF31
LEQQQQQQQPQKTKQHTTKPAEVAKGELPIDQVLQYINNGASGPSRKNGKKSQKRH